MEIEAHRSEQRRTQIVRVLSPQGEAFRLYHPQTWQYLSLELSVAEDICRGFPEYWEDSPDEEREPSGIPIAGNTHRRDALARLASLVFPVPEVFRNNFDSPAFTKEWNDELNSIRTTNPFFLLKRKSDFHLTLNPRTRDYPDHELWRIAALELFEQLARSDNVRRCPSALCRDDDDPSLLPDDVAHQRGRMLASQETLSVRYPRSSKRPIQWGPLFYDEASVSLSHFCIAGMTRSGKTTLLRLLFQSLHQNFVPTPRFVLYDAKPDLMPCMFAPRSLPGEPSDEEAADAVFLLSPYDSRGTAWDIAGDAVNQSRAAEIAKILFPASEGGKEHEFYGPAVRDVTTELMVALTRTAAQKWTFYDLLCAMQVENIQPVLSSTPNGRRLYASYFEGKKSNVPEDLVNSLRIKSALLLPSAYAWSHAKHRLSLRQWVRTQTKSIFLFNDEEHFEANGEINRILLNLLVQSLLSVKNPPARTFLYLDEMEHLGRIGPLTRLINKGADLKVNLAIAFHDLETLKEVYGGATEGILSQANFQAFLKVNSRVTSEWASHQIGTPEVKVSQTSTQSGTSHKSDGEAPSESRQSSQSESEQYASRRLVLPDEIRDLPIPANAKVLRGFFATPMHSPYLGTLPASKVIRSRDEYLAAENREENFFALWPKVAGVSEHCPQSDERYELPDDPFCTLHELGFRRPDYSPPPSEGPSALGIKAEVSSLTEPPPTPPPAQPPVDTAPPMTPESTEPPTEEDDDLDFDFKYPD